MVDDFLIKDRPTLVGMLRSSKAEELLKEIEAMLLEGVDAFGFQIETLEPANRNEENYKKIFSAMQGKPAYVTNYIRCNPLDLTDEELTEQLFSAAKCGAKLIDIRGDLFCREDGEFTTDAEAVKKQIEVVTKLKSMGVQVLMSSHVLKYTPLERVLEIALAQQSRGADVVKIVTEANSEEELMDNFNITLALKEKLNVPFLFLCNGTHCKKHRTLAPLLTNDMFLVVENSNENLGQPTIKKAKEILTLAGYDNLP